MTSTAPVLPDTMRSLAPTDLALLGGALVDVDDWMAVLQAGGEGAAAGRCSAFYTASASAGPLAGIGAQCDREGARHWRWY